MTFTFVNILSAYLLCFTERALPFYFSAGETCRQMPLLRAAKIHAVAKVRMSSGRQVLSSGWLTLHSGWQKGEQGFVAARSHVVYVFFSSLSTRMSSETEVFGLRCSLGSLLTPQQQ